MTLNTFPFIPSGMTSESSDFLGLSSFSSSIGSARAYAERSDGRLDCS